MAYPNVPTFIPGKYPSGSTPMAQYSSWWSSNPPGPNPYAGYGSQMQSLQNQLYGQSNQIAQGQGQPWQAQAMPGGPSYDTWAQTAQQYKLPSQVGTIAAPTAQDANPWMQQLAGGQQSLMQQLTKQMAGAGIRRGGMNVAGGAPLESSLYQQGVGQLGGMYGQNFGQAMGYAQNTANWNRQNQMDQANYANQLTNEAFGANRNQAMDQYNAQLQAAQQANQQHWLDQQNQRGWQGQIAAQGSDAAMKNLQATAYGANWDQMNQAAMRQSYGQDVGNYNQWRQMTPGSGSAYGSGSYGMGGGGSGSGMSWGGGAPSDPNRWGSGMGGNRLNYAQDNTNYSPMTGSSTPQQMQQMQNAYQQRMMQLDQQMQEQNAQNAWSGNEMVQQRLAGAMPGASTGTLSPSAWAAQSWANPYMQRILGGTQNWNNQVSMPKGMKPASMVGNQGIYNI